MLGYDPKDILPPKHGKSPYELLSDNTVDPPSLLSAYGFQGGLAALGGMLQLVKNWHLRRPLIAGKISLDFQLKCLCFEKNYCLF